MLEKDKKINNSLILIPKSEKYIQYMLETIMKMPRAEKFSIGIEYKQSMYKMLEIILLIEKTSDTDKLKYINRVDSELNIQRIFLRIMQKNYWIDNKKFDVSMNMIYELGKIIGGLVKYYAKDNKKRI